MSWLSLMEVRPTRVDLENDTAWDDGLEIPLKTRLYCRPSLYVPTGNADIRRFASRIFKAGRGLLESINALNTLIFNEFVYDQNFAMLRRPSGLFYLKSEVSVRILRI